MTAAAPVRHQATVPRQRRRGLVLAWDADAPDSTGCPEWCTVQHPAGEPFADRAHSSGYRAVSFAAAAGEGPGWLGVCGWQEPGGAAGVSAVQGDHYLPVMSPGGGQTVRPGPAGHRCGSGGGKVGTATAPRWPGGWRGAAAPEAGSAWASGTGTPRVASPAGQVHQPGPRPGQNGGHELMAGEHLPCVAAQRTRAIEAKVTRRHSLPLCLSVRPGKRGVCVASSRLPGPIRRPYAVQRSPRWPS